MAALTHYTIVRMGAGAAMLQPDSTTPVLCGTEQVPSFGDCHEQRNRPSSWAQQLLVCNSESPRVNTSNTGTV